MFKAGVVIEVTILNLVKLKELKFVFISKFVNNVSFLFQMYTTSIR